MQIGTVSGLWFCGRSWRFKIHFWRNVVHIWKPYTCSNKLDVQETNISFSQLNRIWNYLSGHRIETGWFACSGTMGSNCFCLGKYFSCFRSHGATRHKYALKLFWNAYTWHVLEDPIFYGQWTNLHGRSQTWPKLVTNEYLFSCGKHSTTMHTGTVSRLRRSWELRIHFWRSIVFASHTFVPISWMCKKRISGSHSSTESEIIYLDAGLRLDGIPALDLWDLIVAVLHGNTYQSNQERWDPCTDLVRAPPHKPPMRKKISWNDWWSRQVDFISSNVHSSRQEALLYIFEDHEAVIKMIIKERSPTMRHVSRTHRVALHWLFDRINLDSKIQITYIDTKNQLADILTKGNFTRDEWNHLLSLFNISHFSSTALTPAKAKRIQQESGEERVTAKSRPVMNLTARMPSVVSSSTSSSLEKTWYEYQDPGKSVVVGDRSGKLDRLSPAGYSKSDYDRSWSSQEWKSGAAENDRSGNLDKTSWNAVQQVVPHHGEPLLGRKCAFRKVRREHLWWIGTTW